MNAADPTHIVTIDRKWRCTSPTLATAALQRLEAAFRAGRWWQRFPDRWSTRATRAAFLAELSADAPGGLVLLGPRLGFAAPPPFAETFEPVELGANDPQLQTLSGPAPTREERIQRYIFAGLGVLAIAAVWPLTLGVLKLGALRVLGGLGMFGALLALVLLFVWWVLSLNGQWLLVPGGVAILRRRRGRPQIELCTRGDTVANIRLVSNGKTVMTVIELLRRDGRRFRRPVRDREGLAFLAAWQCTQPTPPLQQIRAFVT